jgi:hypothetical protein
MGKIAQEQIGTRYGKLVVIGKSDLRIRNRVCWKCQCDCGNVVDVIGTDLRTGRKTSCGECELHSNIKNEIGNVYGRLTVIKEGGKTKDRHKKWICQCECGNIIEVMGKSLRSGNTQSCGCYKADRIFETQAKDLKGQRFGKLLVLERVDKKYDRTYWKCQCDCGNQVEVSTHNLTSGGSRSCGCVLSYGESKIQQILEELKINFKQQVTFSDLTSSKGGKLKFDFGIFDNQEKLLFLIEYQGKQHFFSGEFGKQQREETDELKNCYCKNNNIKLYYINYNEEIEEKIKEILNEEKIYIDKN